MVAVLAVCDERAGSPLLEGGFSLELSAAVALLLGESWAAGAAEVVEGATQSHL
jgi:hypothetical protein